MDTGEPHVIVSIAAVKAKRQRRLNNKRKLLTFMRLPTRSPNHKPPKRTGKVITRVERWMRFPIKIGVNRFNKAFGT